MEQQQTNQAVLRRKRKFLVVLPLLVFPFMTLLLWSFGLIRPEGAKAQKISQKGINRNLPGARVGKDSNWNKLRFYEQADRDSAKYRSLAKNDPYYKLAPHLDNSNRSPDTGFSASMNRYAGKGFHPSYDQYPSELKSGKDPNEEKVYQKLAQLRKAMNEATPKEDTLNYKGFPVRYNELGADDLRSLENRLSGTQLSGNNGDPAMAQISGMLEKILDIQHPERVTNKIKAQSEAHKQQTFPVRVPDNDNISLLESRGGSGQASKDTQALASRTSPLNGFYSMEDTRPAENGQNAIRAVVPDMQTLVNGATVKLRLADDIYINGIRVPRNEFLYGTATLNGERLVIHITSIRYRDNILPVALSVYDMDGMAGIYVPGAITRDVAKQSTDQAIQSLNIAMLDQSVGAQAASAGIEAAKTLIGKKIRLIKVIIPANYAVLLRDDNQRAN